MELGKRDRIGDDRSDLHHQVTRTIKGSEITRNADDANPAYLVRQEDGDRVLKSHSELSPA